jgi:hypothetical protein
LRKGTAEVAANPVTLETLASVRVYGVPQMLSQLNRIDPALKRATVARMKQAATPMIAEARSLVPDANPLGNWGRWKGGWDAAAVRKGIKVSYKGPTRRDRNRETFPLLRLVNSNAGGSIVDIAGRAGGKGRGSEGALRGQQMIDKITRELGRNASRIAWLAAERHLDDVQKAVEDAIKDMEQAIQARVDRIKVT